MLSTRKAGAYISDMRKRQGMTQAELAARLMVTPQAVSKWETGQALPDLEQMVALSALFGVSINQILMGEEQPVSSGRGTTAREAVAAQADEERSERPGSANLDQIIALAPFLDKETLNALLDQAALPEMSLQQVLALAPFLDSEVVDRYVGLLDCQCRIDHVIALAPFVSRKKLDHLMDRLNGMLSLDQVQALAPFLSSAKSAEILRDRLDQKEPLTLEHLAALAPFLDRDTASRLARQLMSGG